MRELFSIEEKKMKARYKILIIVVVALIPTSFFVPEVFLLFYLDQFESNENCDVIGRQLGLDK